MVCELPVDTCLAFKSGSKVRKYLFVISPKPNCP